MMRFPKPRGQDPLKVYVTSFTWQPFHLPQSLGENMEANGARRLCSLWQLLTSAHLASVTGPASFLPFLWTEGKVASDAFGFSLSWNMMLFDNFIGYILAPVFRPCLVIREHWEQWKGFLWTPTPSFSFSIWSFLTLFFDFGFLLDPALIMSHKYMYSL